MELQLRRKRDRIEELREDRSAALASNAELEAKLDTILTDVKYKGGLQDWIGKYNELLVKVGSLCRQNAELVKDKEKLLSSSFAALLWLEEMFRKDLGGRQFHCPWCYKHPPDDGGEYGWIDIHHTPDCLIGKATTAICAAIDAARKDETK